MGFEKITRTVAALGIALSLNSALKMEKAHAMEVTEHDNFYSLIKKLEKQAWEGKHEVAAQIFVLPDGNQIIISVAHENQRYVSINFEKIKYKFLKEYRKKYNGNPQGKITVCEIHTHPINIYGFNKKTLAKIRNLRISPSMPPSRIDTSDTKFDRFDKAFNREGSAVEYKIMSAVIDVSGLYYYTPMNDKKLKIEFPTIYEHKSKLAIARDRWLKRVSKYVNNLDDIKIKELAKILGVPIRNFHNNLIKDEHELQSMFTEHNLTTVRQIIITKLMKLEHVSSTQLVTSSEFYIYSKLLQKHILMKQRYHNLVYPGLWFKATAKAVNKTALLHSKIYSQIKAAYALIGTDIRFVPFENIEKEPPCAGTDYKNH